MHGNQRGGKLNDHNHHPRPRSLLLLLCLLCAIKMSLSVAPHQMRIEGGEGLQQNAVNVFNCQVAGNPPPKVFWTVEDEDGKRREEGETLNLATKDATREVTIKCHAENSEGELTESRSLPVHHLPSFVTISLPSIRSEDSKGGKSLVEGSLLEVDCTAGSAFPKPSLVWRIEEANGDQILDGLQIKQDERGVGSSSSNDSRSCQKYFPSY